MSYQMRPDDNGMQGTVEYGEKPPIRIKLTLGPEPPTPRRAAPSPVVTSEYDTRTATRGRTQQFTKTGAVVDTNAMMEGVEMMDVYASGAAGGGSSTATKKNNVRGTGSKDARGQMHSSGPGTPGGGQQFSQNLNSPMTPGRPHMNRMGGVGTMHGTTPTHPGMAVGMPGAQNLNANAAYGRAPGMLPPGMAGSPSPYMQSPGSPYMHANHLSMPHGTPGGHGGAHGNSSSNSGAPGTPMQMMTPQMQRGMNVRAPSALDTPMTPGPMGNSGFFPPTEDSAGLGGPGDDIGSNLGSDDEDGDDKSKKNNKRGKPKNRGSSNRKKEEDDIFGDEDPQSAGYNAAVAIWKTVEAYFADFNDEDFRLVAVDAKDDAFRVPTLGKKPPVSHAAALAGSNAQMLQHSQSDMDIAPKLDSGGLFGGPNGPSFVTRLISSLIEETSMPSFPNYLAARPPLQDIAIPPSEQDPLFGIVSQQEAEFIESRVQKELISLGLFGDFDATSSTSQDGGSSSSNNNNNNANGTSNGTSSNGSKDGAGAKGAGKDSKNDEKDVDDDDEVLSELKRLQTKLRARLDQNNQTRLILRQQMDAANGERKRAKEEREALAKLDQSFIQQHKAILKKRKKPTAKQAAAAKKNSKAEGSSSGQ